MNALNSVLIEKIVLENFQSIRERVEIPVKPLTFLFGPNSAGKSSIFDSIEFVNAFFQNDRSIVENLFRRWAHIRPRNTQGKPNLIEKMVIEVKFSSWEFLMGGGLGVLGDLASVPEEFWCSPKFNNLIKESNGPYEIKLELIPTEFQNKEDGFISSSLMEHYNLTVVANGENIMRLYSPEGNGEYEVEFYPSAFGNTFDILADRHRNVADDPRLYIVRCWPHNFGRGLELQDDADNDIYEIDLVKIANHIIRCFSESDFLPYIVSSDRSTISNSDLSNFFNSPYAVSGIPANLLNAPIGTVKKFCDIKNGTIKSLSSSKFNEILIERGIDNKSNDDETLIDFVNRSLSHHLFLDQGYQIAFDVCELLPASHVNFKKDSYVALMILHLLDNSGRRMTFEDVGTGISCVIPVLVAMYQSQSFIQQPELHLHPALQSSLGDILVESVNSKDPGRHFIETHSDYLLLRCLRRIRETSNGRLSKESNLKLSPSDISVLYFDPHADGATKIKTIRISSQGDFIDRWPRGFFDERGKDIFDE